MKVTSYAKLGSAFLSHLVNLTTTESSKIVSVKTHFLLLKGESSRVDALQKREVRNGCEQYSVHTSSAGDKLPVLMSVLAVVTCDKLRFLLPSKCIPECLSALAVNSGAILQKVLSLIVTTSSHI